VRLLQDFTTDPDQLEKTLRNLSAARGDAAALDAVAEALKLLEQRRPERRRVILLIAEKHDRASRRKFGDVLRDVQRQNVLIYWLTYSPTLTGLGAKPKGTVAPYDSGSQNLLRIIPELATMGKPAAAQELSKATGGRSVGFLKQDALEEAIQSVASEVHRQYMVSFQPKPSAAPRFHAIRVAVKDRPELLARTRAGYWPLQ
jgi:VWFA-related protein